MTTSRVEHDGLGPVNVRADNLRGAQTQRSLEHFKIGDDLIPREMIPAYAIVKKAVAFVNHQAGRLGDTQKDLIVRVARVVFDSNVAGVKDPTDCEAFIRIQLYKLKYRSLA